MQCAVDRSLREVLGSGFDALRQATCGGFRRADAKQWAATGNLRRAVWSDCGAVGCGTRFKIVLGSRCNAMGCERQPKNGFERGCEAVACERQF